MSVPKLRFKEFDGDWEKTTLGEVVKFSNGKRVPLSETDRQKRQGKYRYYGASGVIDYVDDYLFDGQYILIGEDGANILTRSSTLAFVVEGKFWVNNHAHIFQSKKGDNTFLATYLESLNYEKYNSGTAQPKLNLENLKKVIVANPSKDEQTKIASFLSNVDEKISQLNQKHALLSQYKQGMMQKLFSQQIRFKADDGSEFGEWEEKQLGEIIKFVNGKGHENDVDSDGSYTLINSKFLSTNGSVAKKVNKCNQKVMNDSLVMVMSDVPNGKALAKVMYIQDGSNFALNQRIGMFIFHKDHYPKFFQYQLNRHQYYLAFDSGVGQTNLKKEDVLNCPILVPCIEEQTTIANFLSAIDQKIEVVTQQIEQAKQWKKGLLQQMFV